MKKEDRITVVAPGDRFTWFPSLIWVATGTMSEERVHFPLAPVYKSSASTTSMGAPNDRSRRPKRNGAPAKQPNEVLPYDLLNATGPYLNFEDAGLGPKAGTTQSICSVEHAVGARNAYLESVKRMEKGERQRLVVGVGHPAATCEGAAFEHVMNLDADMRRRGVRDHAELIFLPTNPTRETSASTASRRASAARSSPGIHWCACLR